MSGLGNNFFIGAFSAVNESTWEHLKLLFFPMLITTIIGCLAFKNSFPNYVCSKTWGIVISLLFIVIFFYTYTGILGINIGIIDILSFFVAVIIAEIVTIKQLFLHPFCNKKLFILLLILLLVCFIVFTYFTPQIGLFQDPIDGSYGIKRGLF